MSGLTAWQLPSELPEGVQSRGSSLVQVRGDWAVGVLPKTFTTPLLGAETEPWVRPSGSVSFPLHPLGGLELYQRALALGEGTDLVTVLRSEFEPEFRAFLWRAVLALFRPGAPVRARIDHLVEREAQRATVTEEQPPAAAQLSAAATWLVITAAVAWAREASS